MAHVLDDDGGGPVRRAFADFKRAYEEAFFDDGGRYRGYPSGFRDGLDELVAEKVLQQDQVTAIVTGHVRGPVVHPPGWTEGYSAEDDRRTHVEEGRQSGWGAGYDIGFEDARTRYGYSRHYRAIPAQHVALALKDNNRTCVYCNAAPCADVDHVVPLRVHWTLRGARLDLATRSDEANAESNLVGACATCNRSKGAKQLRRGWDPPAWQGGQWWPFGPDRVRAANSPPPYA